MGYLRRLCLGRRAPLRGHVGDVYNVTFAPDGRTLASTGEGRDSTPLGCGLGSDAFRVLRGHDDEVNWLSISPNGRLVASVSEDKTVKLWDISTADCLDTLTDHFEEVVAAVFSPDGRWLATGAADGVLSSGMP